jgi:hypothetical protein
LLLSWVCGYGCCAAGIVVGLSRERASAHVAGSLPHCARQKLKANSVAQPLAQPPQRRCAAQRAAGMIATLAKALSPNGTACPRDWRGEEMNVSRLRDCKVSRPGLKPGSFKATLTDGKLLISFEWPLRFRQNPPLLSDLEQRFGGKRRVFVGDRGMVRSANPAVASEHGHGCIVGRNRCRRGEV